MDESRIVLKKSKIAILIVGILSLMLISACSVRYTNFSYMIRECIPDDNSSIHADSTSISINRIANLSQIRFEKQDNTVKMYYRSQASCRFYDIKIMNLSKGTYVLETYDIKYEDVSVFELTNSTNVTIV